MCHMTRLRNIMQHFMKIVKSDCILHTTAMIVMQSWIVGLYPLMCRMTTLHNIAQ